MAISNDQKKQIAESTLEILEMQWERECLILGEDPDEFEIASIDFSNEENSMKYGSIKNLSDRIVKIQNRIKEL